MAYLFLTGTPPKDRQGFEGNTKAKMAGLGAKFHFAHSWNPQKVREALDTGQIKTVVFIGCPMETVAKAKAFIEKEFSLNSLNLYGISNHPIEGVETISSLKDLVKQVMAKEAA